MRKIALNVLTIAAFVAMSAFFAIMAAEWIGWRQVSQNAAFFDALRSTIGCLVFWMILKSTKKDETPHWSWVLFLGLMWVTLFEFILGFKIIPPA
ncbi:MAG: hypothetical protein Q8R25_03830 [bacterium]|nr:hypothetical protein [bacterium]